MWSSVLSDSASGYLNAKENSAIVGCDTAQWKEVTVHFLQHGLTLTTLSFDLVGFPMARLFRKGLRVGTSLRAAVNASFHTVPEWTGIQYRQTR